MANEERIPGLTLYLDDAALKGSSGVIRLRASVNSKEAWEAVLKRIDGHRIYATDNVAQTAVNLLQEDVQSMEAELQRVRQETHEKVERLAAENSMLRSNEAEWAAQVKQLTDELTAANNLAASWKAYADQKG